MTWLPVCNEETLWGYLCYAFTEQQQQLQAYSKSVGDLQAIRDQLESKLQEDACEYEQQMSELIKSHQVLSTSIPLFPLFPPVVWSWFNEGWETLFLTFLSDVCLWVDRFVILAGNWITYSEGTEALGNTESFTVYFISLYWLTSNAASCSPSKLQCTTEIRKVKLQVQ